MVAEAISVSRRRLLKQAMVGGISVFVAACVPATPAPAPATAPPEEVAPTRAPATVRFLTQGGAQVAFDRYEPLIEMFQEANPDLTVEPIWEPGGAIEVQTKLLTLIAAGDAPDVYWAHTYTNAGQAKRDIQMDIQPMVEADPSVNPEDFLAGAWADFNVAGKQIGIPRETTSTVLIYNKALFEELGLPLPTDNWTWSDFLLAAQAMTTGEGAERVYGTADWNLNRNTWIKMWQKGGDVVNQDRTQFTMNQEPSVSQVALIQDWHHDPQIHIPGVEKGGFSTGDLFTTGRIGMFPQFSVFDNVMPSEFEWDIAHLPRDADDVQTTRVASAGHSMYSGTKQPQAAWQWMSFLTTEEAFWHWVATGLKVPSRISVAQDPKFLDPTQPPEHAQIMIDAFAYGRPEPVAGDWIGVHREIQAALDSIYGIEKPDVQASLDAIAERVNELIAFVPGE
ncbi:MAG: sugar ABC transporter substrate-binding protein [Anaerolineae bacterium]|nr:sugar ABC transporter substrate-binding protein [Anaerolineae bacterium]